MNILQVFPCVDLGNGHSEQLRNGEGWLESSR